MPYSIYLFVMVIMVYEFVNDGVNPLYNLPFVFNLDRYISIIS